MRNLLLLLLGLWMNSGYSQTRVNQTAVTDYSFNSEFLKNKPATIKGQIINSTATELSKIQLFYILVLPSARYQEKKFIKVNNAGIFNITLANALPNQQIFLRIGNYYQAIYVNKNLTIKVDFLKVQKKTVPADAVKFDGPDVDLINFMSSANLFDDHIKSRILEKMSDLKISDSKYLAQIEALLYEFKEFQKAFKKQNYSKYHLLLENEFLSEYYANLLNHFLYTDRKPGREIWDKIKSHKVYLTSNSGMAFLNSLYKFAKYSNHLIKLADKETTLSEARQLEKIFGHPYADVLKIQMVNDDPVEFKNMIKDILPTIKSQWCKIVIQQEYDTLANRLNKVNDIVKQIKGVDSDKVIGTAIGELPIGAKLSVIKSMNSGDFLTKLKTLYANKVIVLDFWATWCGGCIQDMPAGIALKKKANDLPIEFIYICTSSGSTMDKWKNKIIEMKISGTHIFVDEKLVTELMTLFGKSAFPSYIVFNKAGKIIPGAIKFMGTTTIQDLQKYCE